MYIVIIVKVNNGTEDFAILLVMATFLGLS